MKPANHGPLTYRPAPSWVEDSIPQRQVRQDVYSVLVLRMPADNHWTVASLAETDTLSDPHSSIGRLLRAHCDCGLLALPHVSDN